MSKKTKPDPIERMLDILDDFDSKRSEKERAAGFERFLRATDALAARHAPQQPGGTPPAAAPARSRRASAHTR